VVQSQSGNVVGVMNRNTIVKVSTWYKRRNITYAYKDLRYKTNLRHIKAEYMLQLIPHHFSHAIILTLAVTLHGKLGILISHPSIY